MIVHIRRFLGYNVKWRKLYLGINKHVIVASWSHICVIDYFILVWLWSIILFISSSEFCVLRSLSMW